MKTELAIALAREAVQLYRVRRTGSALAKVMDRLGEILDGDEPATEAAPGPNAVGKTPITETPKTTKKAAKKKTFSSSASE